MSICDYYATIPGLGPEALEELASTAFAYASSDTCGPSLLYHLFYLRPAGVRSTRIVGRRTAPFPPFLISNRVPYGFYPKILVLTALDIAIPGHPGAPRGAGGS